MVKEKSPDRQTEEKIFRAATEIFEEKGYAAARMQEIADRAGINKALLHYYFRSKEQLFGAIFNPLLQKMFEKIFSIFLLDIPFEQKIRIYYEEHISFLIKNPKLPIFLLNEIAHKPELIKGLTNPVQFSRMRDAIFIKHEKELMEYGIGEKDMMQLMVSVISLSIFPFVARDVMKSMYFYMGDNTNFNAFMEERKEFAADFVIHSLKNRKK